MSSPSSNLRRCLIGLVVLAVGVAMWWGTVESSREKLDRAGRLLSEKRFVEAAELAESVPATSDEAWEAWVLAGQAFTRARQYDRALEVYGRVPDRGGRAAVSARGGAAAVLLDQRKLLQAETELLRLEAISPDHPLVGEGLAHVLNVSARRHEAVPRMLAAAIAERGPPALELLVMLADVERPFGGLKYLERCREAAPTDPLPVLGLAAAALAENDTKRAELLAREVLEGGKIEAGEVAGAVAGRIIGLVLAESGRDGEFLEWHRGLEESAETDPLVWLARGLFLQRGGRMSEAARCLWSAIDLQPNLRQANHLLGQCLRTLGRDDDAKVFLERARRLEGLVRLLEHIEVRLGAEFSSRDAELWLQLVKGLQQLGRETEARHWARAAIARDLGLIWARELLTSPPRGRDIDLLEQTIASARPTHQIDLSDLPLPEWSSIRGPAVAAVAAAGGGSGSGGRIRFDEIGAAAGIDFTYFQSPDLSTPGARMFENTGGGVAVFDFDRDGWPDLYFTQGSRWPGDSAGGESGEEEAMRDRLFRNNADGTFTDVTGSAGLGDDRFSQGVAVGDIDHDGWPDLYVANIGGNRLYRNNTDGTFDEWPIGKRGSGDDWTTSCVVADIDGDGHVDLYDVNYLTGPGVFTRICQTQGVPFACHPNEFLGAQDRFWRGDGSGGFVDATRSAGFRSNDGSDGKGLGVVAARYGEFDAESGSGLGLFIANDAVANFLFVAGAEGVEGVEGVREQALLRGVAYDRDGRPQACMGVAAGDADGDGRLDLFVTNFYAESNVLYRQGQGQGQGVHFSDVTRMAGLREPGWRMLGFGTQFLDADLDGRLDLVIANGHVDDLSKLGQPYRMRHQVMHNVGGGRFVEIDAKGLGPFFEKELLGRGLARGDLDRDGREDFVISHLDDPVAVLVNRTERAGNWLAVRLVARNSARDAIGAQVTVRTGSTKQVHQLTAGDGYQASNQRQLVIGLGGAQRVEELTVSWPSGQTTRIESIEAGGEVVVIEGVGTAWRLPR